MFIVFAAAMSVGCTQTNQSHCGNQQGDLTCAQRDPATPYCDLCEVTNHGCLASPVDEPSCAWSTETTGVTSDGLTTDGLPTESDASAGPGPSTDETGSMCGNGVLDPGEACDGATVPEGSNCSTEGFGDGVPGCLDDCSMLDYTSCPAFVGCGDGLVGDGEQCDGTSLAGQSCEQFPGFRGPGLACNPDCTLNMDECEPCVITGQECMPDVDVCCEVNHTCGGLVTKTCCQGMDCSV